MRIPPQGPVRSNTRLVTNCRGVISEMAKQSILKEFFLFIKHEKKWWMVPLIAVLLAVGLLIVFASSSPLAPFLYPLF